MEKKATKKVVAYPDEVGEERSARSEGSPAAGRGSSEGEEDKTASGVGMAYFGNEKQNIKIGRI
jgi:hypothetical protein